MSKPVVVTLTVYMDGQTAVKIDKPGPAVPYVLKDGRGKHPRRYHDRSTALRGARRSLNAVPWHEVPAHTMKAKDRRRWYTLVGKRWVGIEFVTRRSAK